MSNALQVAIRRRRRNCIPDPDHSRRGRRTSSRSSTRCHPVIGGWIAAGFMACLGLGHVAAQTVGTNSDRLFRFGFSTGLMAEVSENDSRAAMKVWVETVLKTSPLRADPDVRFCRDFADMLAALKTGRVDGLAATSLDLLALRQQVKFARYVFGVTEGSITDEYVLLVHQDSGLNKLADLQGHSLNILRHSRMNLGLPWFDNLLGEHGFRPAQDFLGKITEELKLTKAVLPVFFRKADACLVTRKGFNTMAELNPQVSRQLRVLAASPPLVTTGFFFREGIPPAQLDQCLMEFTRVHQTTGGRQILTVFQFERLEEHPASVLDSAAELLAKHQRLLQTNAHPARATEIPTPPGPAKPGGAE